ncbi:MAG: TatD family hydrolase [Candidatus Heimdallarchaeota archaeon]
MFIDTHLHLEKRWLKDDTNRQFAIDDINKNKIITWAVTSDIQSYKETIEYAKQSKYIFASFGVLPWYAHEYVDRFDEIAKLCEEAIMLGEIGLDEKYAKDKACIPHQKPMFEIFLKEAEKNNKIMNLHFRGKERESFEIIKSYKIKKPIFHGYSGEIDLMKEINDLGYYYSIGRRYNEEKLLEIPDDLLLLEIDVLPTEDFKVPSEVFSDMLERYAKVRNITLEELEAINQKNVLRLIGDDPNLNEMKKLIQG